MIYAFPSFNSLQIKEVLWILPFTHIYGERRFDVGYSLLTLEAAM